MQVRTIATMLLLAAGTVGPPARAEKPPKLDVATLEPSGEAMRCLGNNQIRNFRAVNDRYVMVDAGGNRWFRNELRGKCTGLTPNRIIVRVNTMGQACELDVFRVVDPLSRIDYGLCSFGKFTPVTVPKGARF